MITISQLSQEEVKAFLPVIQELRPHIKTEAQLQKLLQAMQRTEPVEFWGAKKGELPVGFACGVARYSLAANGKYYFLYDLVVKSSLRSQGIGEKLLNTLCEHAKTIQCQSFELESGTSRVRAHKFYLNQGFIISCFNFVKKL